MINPKCVQEERKKDKEHKILSWFTLPQGLCPVLCKLAKISTKRSPISVLQDTILLIAVHTTPCKNHTLLKPIVGVKPMQKTFANNLVQLLPSVTCNLQFQYNKCIKNTNNTQ